MLLVANPRIHTYCRIDSFQEASYKFLIDRAMNTSLTPLRPGYVYKNLPRHANARQGRWILPMIEIFNV
jgi:hypothetical protein